MKSIFKLIGIPFFLSCLVTIIFASIYLSGQQILRQGANDPQIQIAEDTVSSLNSGAAPATLIKSQQIDLAKSLSPFLIIYDNIGNPLASSGQLDGQTPSIPTGVFDIVKENHQNRLTWQPKTGVRIAAVVVKADNGFVLAGRALREVEIREKQLHLQTTLAWLFSLGIILLFGLARFFL